MSRGVLLLPLNKLSQWHRHLHALTTLLEQSCFPAALAEASQLHLRGRQDVGRTPSRDFRAPGPLPGAKSARLLCLGARVHRVAEAGGSAAHGCVCVCVPG